MYRTVWRERKGVSPVIATIMMVAVSVVLVGVLVVYITGMTTTEQKGNTSVTMTMSTFSNPYSDHTTNLGGWSMTITGVTGKRPGIQDLRINVKSGGVAVATFDMHENTSVVSGMSGTVRWYVLEAGNAQFYDADAATPAVVDVQSGSDIDSEEFSSIQKAYIVILDNDGDGRLTPGDTVMVYKDHNADNNADLTDGDRVELMYSDVIIASPCL